MTRTMLRNIKARLLLTARFVWQRKGLLLRAALCWTVGMVFIFADQNIDYDSRLFIRGQQNSDQKIVLINIGQEEWRAWLRNRTNSIMPPSSTAFISDSNFWDEVVWHSFLKKVLDERPQAVGISFYFGENLLTPPTKALRSPYFRDSRVVWSTLYSAEGRVLSTWFGKRRNKTVGLNEPSMDSDGVVRRLSLENEQIPMLAKQLLSRLPDEKTAFTNMTESKPLINFRGQANSFRNISFQEFMSGRFSPDFFRDSIVLVGSTDIEGSLFRTPNGLMSRHEITATVIDNFKNDRWIQRPSSLWIGLLFSIFILVTAWITSHYPQTFAFVLIAAFNLFYTALSLWVFDTFYIWTPIFAVALISVVTYVIFLSFQLTLREYMNVQLENEKQFMFEVEQLKNNFLSLISHDLKTPIAKIQAICDRLIAQHQEQGLTNDLGSLRDVASELHRYIRTILEITRVESRNFSINKDSADINEIVEAVARQLEPLARNKKIHIELQLEPMFLIEVDHILIHEVVLNLIENAIKYTPEGGQVTVSSREVDDQVLVVVEDNGPGIPQNEQMRIFEKFYRGELGKAQPKGSGLGLYLVKYFVQLHNGKVFIESHVNQGTKVGFSLPIDESAKQGRDDVNETNIEMKANTDATHTEHTFS